MPRITNTKESIIQYRKEHPEYSINKIGKLLKVSKQYCWRILKENGLETKKDKTIPNESPKKFTSCPICYTIRENDNKKICNYCREIYYYATVNCPFCKKEIKLRKKYIKLRKRLKLNRRFYCNEICFLLGKKL